MIYMLILIAFIIFSQAALIFSMQILQGYAP